MKQFSFLLLLSLVLIVTSCNKAAKPTTIKGQVRTYGTEEAIQRAPVRVQIVEERVQSCFGCGTSYEVKSQVWTDQDGYFSISADLYEDLTYYLAVNDEELLNDRKYIAPTHGSIDHPSRRINSVGGTIRKNYYLTAYGWVRFHFVSANPQAGDIYGYNLGGGASEIFYDDVDVHRKWDFGGNLTHEIALNKFTNGQWINWQQEIFVPAFDTIDYEVIF